MAYLLFGGRPADFAVITTSVNAAAGGNVDAIVLSGNASLVAYNAGSAGSQITDLKLFTGSYTTEGSAAPAGVFTSQLDGTILVWAQDTVNELWVTGEGSSGQRWLMEPVNLNTRVRAIEAGSYIPSSEKAAASGVATLDGTGKVPSAQLPSGTGGVASVNTLTGAVSLTEANTGFVPNTRSVSAGNGLTGGGNLTTDRSLAVVYGTSTGTAAEGNHTHGGFTTSPRPIAVSVLSTDQPSDRKTAAAADATYTLVCDGTNDEVQINAAIDLASPLQSRNAGMPATAAQMGKVELSGGRFNIGSAGIKMRTAVRLEGQGKGTEVRAVSCNQPGMISLANVNDHLCEIVNMYLNGNSSSGGTCSAIDFDMTASGNTSLYPDSNPDSDHYIANLYIDEFRGTNRHGVYLHSTGTANNRGNIVRDLQIRDCTGGNGIYFSGASDCFIETCHVGGSGDTAFRIAGGNTKMIGNKSFYSNAYGVYVTSGRANITGHESQDDSTAYFFDGVPGTAVGLVSDTSDVAGIRVSNDRLQIIGFNIFVRTSGRYTTQQRGLWYDGAFANCAIIGNVESANITTPISGTPATGTNLVTVS